MFCSSRWVHYKNPPNKLHPLSVNLILHLCVEYEARKENLLVIYLWGPMV